MPSLDCLLSRRSTPSRLLGPPAPDPAQLETLLAAAMRVPDHGALAPWRILAIQGEARARLGEFTARRALELDPTASAAMQEKDRLRFSRAPLVLGVIACPRENSKVPAIEQILSAGNVCFALLQASQALGFGAQWLTGWCAYDEAIAAHLGLAPNERIVGFIHIGTPQQDSVERRRPDWRAHFSIWSG